MKNLSFTLALGAMLCAGGRSAYAQPSAPQTLPDHGKILAYHNHWAAASSTLSDPNPIGSCFGAYIAPTLFFLQTATNGDLGIRASNTSWSLPLGADTHIAFLIDGHFYNYDAINFSSSVITASLNEVQLVTLVKNIESAHSMQLQVGSLSPMNVDLEGSKEILKAFIKCSGLQNFSPNKDAINPFGSSN